MAGSSCEWESRARAFEWIQIEGLRVICEQEAREGVQRRRKGGKDGGGEACL